MSRPQSPVAQAATYIISQMISQHPDLAQTHIIRPIVGSMLDAWHQTTYDAPEEDGMIVVGALDRTVLSEDQIQTLLTLLHRIMIGGEPSPDITHAFLTASVQPLYHLYDFSIKSKSGLREVVEALLSTYFRIVTTKEAVDAFKTILLDKADLDGARVAYFAPGPSGGVAMRLKREPKLLGGNELPIDPAALVAFVQRLDSNELSGDLFVFLLTQYTTFQTLGADPRL